jgi:hypothetical protein
LSCVTFLSRLESTSIASQTTHLRLVGHMQDGF